MTKEEFNIKLRALGVPRFPTDQEYKLIEKVYCYHPSISDIDGKSQCARLYASFGIRIFKDMEATADKAARLEMKIRTCSIELDGLRKEMDALRHGED